MENLLCRGSCPLSQLPLLRQACERMWNKRQRHAHAAQDDTLALRELAERGGTDENRGNASLREVNRVVHTARRARPSVATGGDDRLALLGNGTAQILRDRLPPGRLAVDAHFL